MAEWHDLRVKFWRDLLAVSIRRTSRFSDIYPKPRKWLLPPQAAQDPPTDTTSPNALPPSTLGIAED